MFKWFYWNDLKRIQLAKLSYKLFFVISLQAERRYYQTDLNNALEIVVLEIYNSRNINNFNNESYVRNER